MSILSTIFSAQDNVSGTLENMSNQGSKTSKVFSAIGSVAKTSFIAAGVAIAGAAILGVKTSEDLQKALNGMQTATGTADASMKGYRDSMLEIYNNNFGESFGDIGTAMTQVSNGTGLAGKALQFATQNALLLRDTFGMEVGDSIKGVDSLMKSFGVTTGSAFNLITAGAQAGLDKGGDMMDTLNEYGGTFAAQGFNATEMFNMLSNASKSGIRDVDLAADAIKEFGIRSKDGSTGVAAGFEALGLNATDMTKAFAQGGAVGRKAFTSVTDKLIGMKDPVAQTAAGVALFGTQFEDLGIKGITALSKTTGAISDVEDHIEGLNAIKYNTFGEAMVGIKRNIETGILLPIGDSLLPILSSFANKINDNMPQIKSVVGDAMSSIGNVLKGAGDIINNNIMPAFQTLWEWIEPNMPLIKDSVGTAMDGIKTAFSSAGDSISALIDWCVQYQEILIPLSAGVIAATIAFGLYSLIMGGVTLATTLATAATTAFGVVMAFVTSPIGIVVIAIGLLVAAGVLLYRNWETVKSVAMNVFGAIRDFVGGVVDGIASAFKNMINGVIGGLNSMIGALNGIHVSVPGWVPVLGGKDLGFNIPSIPQLAKGTPDWKGGNAIIGEAGAELVMGPKFGDLPRGSSVLSNDKTTGLLSKLLNPNIPNVSNVSNVSDVSNNNVVNNTDNHVINTTNTHNITPDSVTPSNTINNNDQLINNNQITNNNDNQITNNNDNPVVNYNSASQSVANNNTHNNSNIDNIINNSSNNISNNNTNDTPDMDEKLLGRLEGTMQSTPPILGKQITPPVIDSKTESQDNRVYTIHLGLGEVKSNNREDFLDRVRAALSTILDDEFSDGGEIGV